ncbi:peptidoglycan-binding domain-containing protein [Streptomyces sp. NPDC029216]|uniref:peptidoglycan-binding domain-containing protein n=1 Tax=Streptomyces sp. NPDC029216 TaxID=3154701 RepID=UPI0034111964
MSAERCPECGATGVDCACARGVGFNPLRIRPYMGMPDASGTVPAQPSPQPVLGALAQPGASDGTPFPTLAPEAGSAGPLGEEAATTVLPPVPAAPGAPVPPAPPGAADGGPGPEAWSGAGAGSHEAPTAMIPVQAGPVEWTGAGAGGADGPTAVIPPVAVAPPDAHTRAAEIPGTAEHDRTMRLRAVPPRGSRAAAGRPKRRRTVPLLAGAGAVVVAGVVALALGLFTGSGKDGTALADPGPSVPVAGEAPADPSQTPAGPSESASSSASPSASASASRSASPSASPSASRTSAAPSPSASASAPKTTKPVAPPPPAKPATLRPGDSGPEVLKLQRLLSDQGLYDGRFDGRYGRAVERAVEDFQVEYGVYEDPWGVYGPATRRALEG